MDCPNAMEFPCRDKWYCSLPTKTKTMNTRKELTDRLSALILDEDLDDGKLREASEGLLPNLLDFLNGCTNCIEPKEAVLNDVSAEMERQLLK